jgi:peptide/nickel transport system ATP-binding protein
VGAAILDLLAQLRKELGVSYMFISHDMNTVRAVCDEIVVLYAGQKVESLTRSAFAQAPRHPYFHLLANSVPELRQGWLEEVGAAQRAALPLVQAPVDRAGICSFLDRCPLRVAGVCDSKTPPRHELEGGVEVFCHRSAAELLQLQKTKASPQECVA